MKSFNSIGLIIPTRESDSQVESLNRGIYTVAQQAAEVNIPLSIYLGLDPAASIPRVDSPSFAKVIPTRAAKPTQASALNACIDKAVEELIFFLEEDDFWEPGYLGVILRAYADIPGLQMTTSNQLEVNTSGEILRINDFPTPSSWSITSESLKRMGGFDESFKYHLDNEFLGRASKEGVCRLHVIERTAPISASAAQQVRPWVYNVIASSGPSTVLARHGKADPFIIRTVNSSTRSHELVNSENRHKSREEYQRLIGMYSRIPW